MLEFDDLRQCVADVLGADPETFGADDKLEALDGWDSMNALRVLTNLEREFGVRVDLRKYAAAETLRQLFNLFQSESSKCASM